VDCIVAAARAPPRTGTSDVIDLARRLNCHIWALHKTLEWLAKFKAKYGQLKAAFGCIQAAGRPAGPTSPALRELRAPYLKLECCVKPLRPLFVELKEYPELYADGKSGSSPFVGALAKHRRNKKLVKRLDLDRRAERRPERGETQPAAAPKKPCHKKKQGFCEICSLSFSDLELHLVSETHTSFVRTTSNWVKVDSRSIPYGTLHPLLL
jgi:hypothetical protein